MPPVAFDLDVNLAKSLNYEGFVRIEQQHRRILKGESRNCADSYLHSSITPLFVATEPRFSLRQFVRAGEVNTHNASQAIGCIPSCIDVNLGVEN